MHQLALFVLHNFREHNQLTRSFGEVVVGTNELRGCDVAELRCYLTNWGEVSRSASDKWANMCLVNRYKRELRGRLEVADDAMEYI